MFIVDINNVYNFLDIDHCSILLKYSLMMTL